MIKKKNDQSLREAMNDMFSEMRITPQLQEARIRALWEPIMGATIATYTSSIQVRQQTLYLSMLSAPLKHELNYRKEEIIQRINESLGEAYIQYVVIR